MVNRRVFWVPAFRHLRSTSNVARLRLLIPIKVASIAKGSTQFTFVMDFDKAIYPDLVGDRLESFQFVLGQRRDNQKYGISTSKRSLIDLDLVESEILS